GVGGDAGRLVDDDDVIVVVDDAQLWDDDRDDPRLLLRLPLNAQPSSAAQAVGFAEGDAVEADAAGLCDISGEGARESEHLRQRGVDAGALQSVRHGQRAGLHAQASFSTAPVSAASVSAISVPTTSVSAASVSAATWSFSRVPSNRMPRTTRSATVIMPHTMKMSATL